MKNDYSRTAGELVRDARERHVLSIAKLAAKANVDPRWLSRFEQGIYRNPDPRLMHRLAEALDLEPMTLLTAADYADLPSFAPYLRSKYDMPPEAIDQLQAHLRLLEEHYDRGDGGSSEKRNPRAA